MKIGSDSRKRAERSEGPGASLPARDLEHDVRALAERSRRLSADLPPLSEIVATTERERRNEIRIRIAECEGAVDGELEALALLRKQLSAKGFREYEPLFREASERRVAIGELRDRCQAIFMDSAGFSAAVPVISKPQTAELLQAFHVYRKAFWAMMYKVPAIQRHVLGELRAVTEDGRCPSLIVHSGTAQKIPEDIFRKKVEDVVKAIEPLLEGSKGRISRQDGEVIASLLLTTPIAPEKLNQQLMALKKGMERLVELETRLKCVHGSTRVAAAQKDPSFSEWKRLADDFGGGALYARTMVLALEKAQMPYLRIRQYLTAANQPFVIKLVGEEAKFRRHKEDIVQEGTMGFMHAIEKFDPSSGFALLTYAGFWVRQLALRGFERQSQTVAVPSRLHVPLSKLRSESDSARRASDVTLAKRIGCKTHEVKSLFPLLATPKSIDQQDPGTGRSLASLLQSRQEIPEVTVTQDHDRSSIARRIEAIMRELPERDRAIVIERFGLDGKGERTLKQLGTKFGLTRERVRQLQNQVLWRLREGSIGVRLREIAEELG